MDITWIKADSDDNDMSLSELLNAIGDTVNNIQDAYTKLQTLLDNIEE